MTYEQWEARVPKEIRSDSAWKMEAYRLSLFLADLGWADTEPFFRKLSCCHHADQLRRASSRISASIAEGYSRDTAKARSTFYEYAAGSARETRDWYYKARSLFKSEVVAHRIDLATQIIRLSLKMIGNERRVNRRISVASR